MSAHTAMSGTDGVAVDAHSERDLSRCDPFCPEVQADLVGWFGAMRRQEPVHFNEATGHWFVTSRAAISEALARPDLFSSRMESALKTPPPPDVAEEVARIRETGYERAPVLIYIDPPEHDRQRALVQKAFSSRIVRALEPDVEAIVDDLLDDLARERAVDFVARFALPLPALVIAQMLRVAPERLKDFRRWAYARTGAAGTRPTREQYLRMARDEVDMQRYFAGELERRRAEPQDDLLTAMLDARLGGDDEAEGEPLTLEECLTILSILLVAGMETTTTLLSSTMRHLCEHPDLWEWVREDPSAHPQRLVEESLRMMSPIMAIPRITTADAVLEGVTIPAGSVVFLAFAAANRDEEAFCEPERFDCTRDNARQHLSFGHGKHFCLGAHLARLEATVAWRRMVERFEPPVLRPGNTFPQRPSFVLPSLEELHVELSPRS